MIKGDERRKEIEHHHSVYDNSSTRPERLVETEKREKYQTAR